MELFSTRLIDVDGAIQAQRQRQRIAGPRVHADQLAIVVQPDHGVEGVVLQFADHHFANAGSQAEQQGLDQIVRHGPRRRNLFDLEGNRIGLVDPTQIGRMAFPFMSFSITMGMLVTGSIINPRIFISTSIRVPLSFDITQMHHLTR